MRLCCRVHSSFLPRLVRHTKFPGAKEPQSATKEASGYVLFQQRRWVAKSTNSGHCRSKCKSLVIESCLHIGPCLHSNGMRCFSIDQPNSLSVEEWMEGNEMKRMSRSGHCADLFRAVKWANYRFLFVTGLDGRFWPHRRRWFECIPRM